MKKQLSSMLMMALLSGGCSDNNGSSDESGAFCENQPLFCADDFAKEEGTPIALPTHPTIPVPKPPTVPKDKNDGEVDSDDDGGSSVKKGASLPDDTDADGDGVIFVDDEASAISPDGSFKKPYSDIEKAIEVASNKKKIVRFYGGTYEDINLAINSKVSLEGGYYCEDDNGNSVEPAQCPSEFNIKREVFETDVADICKANDRLSRLIGTKDGATLTLYADATVDGFYIESPADNGQFGTIDIYNANPTLRNNIVHALPKAYETVNVAISRAIESHDGSAFLTISSNHIIAGNPQIGNSPQMNIGMAFDIHTFDFATISHNCVGMGPALTSIALQVYAESTDFPLVLFQDNHVNMKPAQNSYGVKITDLQFAAINNNHFTLEASADTKTIRGIQIKNTKDSKSSSFMTTNLLVLGTKDNKIEKNHAFVFENTDYNLYSNTVVQGESDLTTVVYLEGGQKGELINNLFSATESSRTVFYKYKNQDPDKNGISQLALLKNNLFDENYVFFQLSNYLGKEEIKWDDYFDLLDNNSGDKKDNLHDDPQLGNNYKPSATSPAIEAGYDPKSDDGSKPVPNFPKLDILGEPLSDPPTIGCFQM